MEAWFDTAKTLFIIMVELLFTYILLVVYRLKCLSLVTTSKMLYVIILYVAYITRQFKNICLLRPTSP